MILTIAGYSDVGNAQAVSESCYVKQSYHPLNGPYMRMQRLALVALV